MTWAWLIGIAVIIAVDIPILRQMGQKGRTRMLLVYSALIGILIVWIVLLSGNKNPEGPLEGLIRMFSDIFHLT